MRSRDSRTSVHYGVWLCHVACARVDHGQQRYTGEGRIELCIVYAVSFIAYRLSGTSSYLIKLALLHNGPLCHTCALILHVFHRSNPQLNRRPATCQSPHPPFQRRRVQPNISPSTSPLTYSPRPLTSRLRRALPWSIPSLAIPSGPNTHPPHLPDHPLRSTYLPCFLADRAHFMFCAFMFCAFMFRARRRHLLRDAQPQPH